MGAENPQGRTKPQSEPLSTPERGKVAERLVGYLVSASDQVAYTVRVPDGMWVMLKGRAIRSTLQVLVEHAFLLYLRSRPPPHLLRGQEWHDEIDDLPELEYEAGEMRQIGTRIPKAIVRWAKVFAAEADITDQELALRVFDWYLRTGKVPPKREEVQRTGHGFLKVPDKLIGLELRDISDDQLDRALAVLEENEAAYSRLDQGKKESTGPTETSLVGGGAREKTGYPQKARTGAGGRENSRR